MRHDFESLSLPRLRKAAAEASARAMPSGAHLLLRDARVALRRGKLRIAVIDAGSGVGLALAAFNKNVTHVKTPAKPTVGWYVQEAKIQGSARLPTSLKADLVDVRNDAVHHNYQPSRAEAVRGLALARKVLGTVEPLPV
jgi:hypothetical protein